MYNNYHYYEISFIMKYFRIIVIKQHCRDEWQTVEKNLEERLPLKPGNNSSGGNTAGPPAIWVSYEKSIDFPGWLGWT